MFTLTLMKSPSDHCLQQELADTPQKSQSLILFHGGFQASCFFWSVFLTISMSISCPDLRWLIGGFM